MGRPASKTMQDPNSAAELYDYPFSQLVITYLLMPLVSLTSIVFGVFLLTVDDGAVVGAFLILFGPSLLFLSAFGSLMCSSIAISDEGIAARNFGRTLKFIRWKDVTKIKKVRRWNAGSRSYQDDFYVFDGDFPALRERMVNLRGPIAFRDQILRVRDLLDKINASAQQHHFLLVSLDQETGSEVAVQCIQTGQPAQISSGRSPDERSEIQD
jgi:hypothetical protein